MDKRAIVDEFLTLSDEEKEYERLWREGLSPAFPPYIREKGGTVRLDADQFLDSVWCNVVKHPCFLPRYMHDHSFIEVALVLSGTCRQEISGECFSMAEGEALIIAPRHFHSISVFDEKSVVLNLIVPLEAMSLIAPLFAQDKSEEAAFILSLSTDNPTAAALLVKGIDECLSPLAALIEGAASSALTLSSLSSFFALLLGKSQSLTFYGKEEGKAMKLTLALSLIRNNPRDMTLTYLAEETGLSPAYLSAFIHASTGLKFSELVTRRRMEVACALLEEETAPSLEEIACKIGYGSAQHFCRKFKAWSGMTPMEWRKARIMQDRTSL